MWSDLERKKWGIILFIGCCVLYMSRVILPTTSIYLMQELKWSHKQLGVAMGIFFWGYMLTQYLGGYVSDRYDGEKVIFYSSLVWNFITILFVWLPDIGSFFKNPGEVIESSGANTQVANSSVERIYASFIICRFLQGCAQGFFYPSLASILSKRVSPMKKQFIFAFISSGSNLGTLFCGIFGSLFAEILGWRAAFQLVGCAGLLWVLFLNSQLNWRASDHPKKTKIDMEKGNLSASKDNHEKTNEKLDFYLIFTSPQFLSVIIANFAFSNTFYILLNWLPTYFNDHFPDARSWVFNCIPWLIICPCVIFGGFIAEQMTKRGFPIILIRKLLNTIALIFPSLFLNLLTLSDDYTTCLCLMSLAIASCGFHNSGVLVNAQEIAPKKCGQIYGIVTTIGTIPGFLGVYITGYILETTHDWSLVFQMAGLLNFFGWLIYTIYGSTNPIF